MLSFRFGRSVGPTVVLLCLSACTGEHDTRMIRALGQVPNRKLDVLFMVDQSTSMASSQASLVLNFPAFMDVLQGLPQGLPDVHVAVVSSDLGAGDGSIFRCTVDGDRGVFQSAPRAPCTNTTLAPGARFISNEAGVANYRAADISDVFACIALLGERGCGFENQMGAVVRALGADGMPAPPENAGFLRPDAYLAVVFVTNEDDCTTAHPSPLHDSSSRLVADPYGPPGNFRCNEFGHRCGGPLAPPPRVPPGGDASQVVTLDGCTSAEGGLLTPVSKIAAQLRALKADPDRQILVTAIAGPPQPYAVRWRTGSASDPSPWPTVVHSCTAADGSNGDPAVRIAQLVEGFGSNGLFYSICEPNLAPALSLIAARISVMMDPPDAGAGGSGGATGRGGYGGAGGGAGRGGAAGVAPDAGAGGQAGRADMADDRWPRLAPRDGCMCAAPAGAGSPPASLAALGLIVAGLRLRPRRRR